MCKCSLCFLQMLKEMCAYVVRMLSCACWWPLLVLVQFIDLAARPYKTVTAQSVTLAATSLTQCVSAGGKKTPVQYGVTHTLVQYMWESVCTWSRWRCVFTCLFEGCSVFSHLFPWEFIYEVLDQITGFMQEVEAKVNKAENWPSGNVCTQSSPAVVPSPEIRTYS